MGVGLTPIAIIQDETDTAKNLYLAPPMKENIDCLESFGSKTDARQIITKVRGY